MNKVLQSIVLILVFLISQITYSQSTGRLEESVKFKSEILHQQISYTVYLPPSYYNSKVAYPVLYLLHGFGGNDMSWIKRCNISNISDSLFSTGTVPEMIIVMPNGYNSYFINSYNGDFAFEDYFIKELIPHINNIYRTDTSHSKTSIGGLSMGGFGAAILSAKHPDIFGNNIILSGAIRTPDLFTSLPQDRYEKYFGGIYGKSLIGENRLTDHWKQNSPFFIIDGTNTKALKSINWYIDCGMQDFLYPANEAFHELLLKYGIPHEFHMRIGKHNWEYWRSGFINGMLFISKKQRNTF